MIHALLASLLLAASLSATPIHEVPHYWTANVNGSDAHNELYGPFKSPRAAEKFCRRIPSMYRCIVTPHHSAGRMAAERSEVMGAEAYATVFNRAVDDANAFGVTMQLLAQKNYGEIEYVVRFAVGDGKRFGVDAEGEFIKPCTPKMRVQPTITWPKIATAMDLWARGQSPDDSPEAWGSLAGLAIAYRAMIRAEEAESKSALTSP